jgi:hypothetical protein
MIQINLIPDIKQELLRAQRTRRTAIGIAIMVGVASVGVVALLGAILGVQLVREVAANQTIDDEYKMFKDVDNIEDVITIQNQLQAISAYQKDRTMNSRIFDVLGAINPASPNNARFSSVRLDPTENLITIEGSAANGYAATETLRKTILNTQVESTLDGETTTTPLTDEVTIGETSYGEASDGSRVLSFTISFMYPDGLFDNTRKNIKVITPTAKTDVTDSKTRVPESLFTEKADTEGDN